MLFFQHSLLEPGVCITLKKKVLFQLFVCLAANSFCGIYSFFKVEECGNFRIVSALWQFFINWIVAMETIEGGNYSRKETICGNTIHTHYTNQQLPFKFKTEAEILTSNSVGTQWFFLGCNQDNNHVASALKCCIISFL